MGNLHITVTYMPHRHIRDGNMPGSNMSGSNTSDLIRHSNITVDNLLISGISIYSNHNYIDVRITNTNIGIFNTNGSK